MIWQLHGGPSDGQEIPFPDHCKIIDIRIAAETPIVPLLPNEFTHLAPRRVHVYTATKPGRADYNHTTP